MFPRPYLALDRLSVGGLTEDEVRESLLPLIRSNHYTVDLERGIVRVEGPDTSYHEIDPFLDQGLSYCRIDRSKQDPAGFHISTPLFDLCLEDSWCGLFLAGRIAHLPPEIPLIIIHLDDHTDMMSTLLLAGDHLTDPFTGEQFFADNPRCWLAAIASGAIGIGSFLTPFFFLARRLHIAHLSDGPGHAGLYNVEPSVIRHPLLESTGFFDINLDPKDDRFVSLRTYSKSGDPVRLIEGASADRSTYVVVHIDLDYFINDFNGNPAPDSYLPSPELQSAALDKMDAFFDALKGQRVSVDRWMIATSPGFCSGYHWEFLIEALSTRIRSCPSS